MFTNQENTHSVVAFLTFFHLPVNILTALTSSVMKSVQSEPLKFKLSYRVSVKKLLTSSPKPNVQALFLSQMFCPKTLA